jgi:hypothetical protein
LLALPGVLGALLAPFWIARFGLSTTDSSCSWARTG